jgi:hypothetical protein
VYVSMVLVFWAREIASAEMANSDLRKLINRSNILLLAQ